MAGHPTYHVTLQTVKQMVLTFQITLTGTETAGRKTFDRGSFGGIIAVMGGGGGSTRCLPGNNYKR